MTTFNVSIPENKIPFFQEFLDMMGASYEKKENEDFIIPEWHKKILDERLEDYRKNPNDVMDFDVMMQDLRKKYNL